MEKPFDLLSTVEAGGCAAKLPAGLLSEIVSSIKSLRSENLLVGNDTSDDALVYKLDENTAIIQTTDFFPPLCSDPYTFGRIAATNALSDIYAMGGKALTALNIAIFPSAKIDTNVLKEILRGGADACIEAGAVLAGGHTIDGEVPVYGLSVTGVVHPDKIVTNNSATIGDQLILTKAIGTGTIMAGKKIGELTDDLYDGALSSMMQLNKAAGDILQKYSIKCATDITGFSLLGHALEIAKGSGVTIEIESSKMALLPGAYELCDMGCIPGASFRNLNYVELGLELSDRVDYNLKMLSLDAQTSGGLLIACPKEKSETMVDELRKAGYTYSTIIGKVCERAASASYVRLI